jgi:hypothetical protein
VSQAAAALDAARGWTLPEARRAALLERRARRQARASLQRAGSQYNAAVAAYRAGQRERAGALARSAGEHPGYHDKAEDLISRLR